MNCRLDHKNNDEDNQQDQDDGSNDRAYTARVHPIERFQPISSGRSVAGGAAESSEVRSDSKPRQILVKAQSGYRFDWRLLRRWCHRDFQSYQRRERRKEPRRAGYCLGSYTIRFQTTPPDCGESSKTVPQPPRINRQQAAFVEQLPEVFLPLAGG